MSVEIVVASAAIAGNVLIAVGLMASWRRNGKSQIARDQELKDDVKSVISRLDDENTGLGALNVAVHGMQRHCAEVSTGLTRDLKAAERDIKEIKSNR